MSDTPTVKAKLLDTTNNKYVIPYVNVATQFEAGTVIPDGMTILVDENGIITAVGGVDVDSELSESSENPVENKVITAALDQKQPVIANLAEIEAGAAAGATAVQPAALEDYVTESAAAEFLTESDLAEYVTESAAEAFLTEADLADYLTKTEAEDTYARKDEIPTVQGTIKAGDNITIEEESESGETYMVISATGGGSTPELTWFKNNVGYSIDTQLDLVTPKLVKVYKNGVLLEIASGEDESESGWDANDYHISGSTIIFASDLVVTDKVTVEIFK